MSIKLVDPKNPPTDLFLNNQRVKGNGEELKLKNPKDGSSVEINPLYGASEEDVDQAVSFATEGFTGPWSKFTGEQRAVCLNKFADLLEQHCEEISYLESICSGRPLGMLLREMPRVAAVYRYYAGWTDKMKGDSYPPEDGFYKIVQHEPLGVCAGITAWNASLHFMAWKSAPALATGNTVILKPSEKSPLGILAAASLISAAGFPPGVFQVISGGGSVGALLSNHMQIQKISFTGSTTTGQKIQVAAAKSNLKRVTLELGGKSAAIVFDDADFEKALMWCERGITYNSGQVCAATSRLFVHESVADRLIARLTEKFQAYEAALGKDPQQLDTQYGPLVDEAQYCRVREYIADAQQEAAPIVCGKDNAGQKGYYIAPAIFLNPARDSKIYRQEIFGPVLCIKTFQTEDEAVKLANDTEYGLSGSIYTQDINRALRVSRAVRAGTLGINCASVVGPQVPMGGFKMSGIGREMGEYALRHYTEPKSVWINLM